MIDKDFVINSIGENLAHIFQDDPHFKFHIVEYWHTIKQLLNIDLNKPVWIYADAMCPKIETTKRENDDTFYVKIDVNHSLKTGNLTTFVQSKEYWDFIDNIQKYKSECVDLTQALTIELTHLVKDVYPKSNTENFDFEDVSFLECFLNHFFEVWYGEQMDPTMLSAFYEQANGILKNLKGLNPIFDKHYFES